MRLGAHLPVADFGDGLPTATALRDYVLAARDAGFDAVAANDHLRWRRPWLDGLSALAAVAADAGGMTLATTVALPVVRHPAVLAAALTSLAALHPGPVVAGIGPGSGRADYAAVDIPFAERWSVRRGRPGAAPVAGRHGPTSVVRQLGITRPSARPRGRRRRLDRVRLQRPPVGLRSGPRRARRAPARRGPRPRRVPGPDRHRVAAGHRQRRRSRRPPARRAR